ncbi:Rne/Rng family ribonuclease [Candidatus Palauibacter sp.]|uniref:Rne/Rng family ribonuclease n=1 Tax=Candidatus Palauibacter sp. TaxID=3101350 RepID=UPI003B01F575
MRREIVVNATTREKRVAILEDRQLVELMYERPDERRIVGDIYLGVVEAIVPGLQAAFVDIGAEKSGFLHASDLEPDEDDDEDEVTDPNGANGGRRRNRDRSHPPIQDQLSKGQPLLVQVTKESIGTKGPRITAQISLPGRFLVYLPGSSHIGVSRKIAEREVRAGLRRMVREILGDEGGVIVRTVGEEMTKETCTGELRALRKAWTKIRRKQRGVKAPALVYQDARFTSGVIRDLFSDRIDLLTVDSQDLHHEIKSYLGQVDPGGLDRVRLYEDSKPIFDEFGIEEELRRAFRRNVRLPAGGHVVIEQTEALVSIDVNTGRYTGRRDPAQTILKTNLEAATEIARQLRLRDVGGIIVIDFIDMNDEESRQKVVQQMRTLLGRDRARTKVFGLSELGLLQLSRQRVSPSLHQRMMEPCRCCEGEGMILASETVVRRVERALDRVAAAGKERGITILTHPVIALHFLEREREFLNRKRASAGIPLELRDNPLLRLDEFRLLAHPAESDVTKKYISSE